MTPRSNASLPAVILDRDGVINQDSAEFIKTTAKWVPIPGSLDAIARLHRAGYRVIVATNQSGVGRGYLSLDTLQQIHEHMLHVVRQSGGDLAGIFFCPHRPGEGCHCRKPAPGLLLEIESQLGIDLRRSYVVGDAERDIIAARRVGAHPVLVKTGKGLETLRNMTDYSDVAVYDDLAAFVRALLNAEGPVLGQSEMAL